MIPARKFSLGEYLVEGMIDNSFRSHFDRIHYRQRCQYTDEQRKLPMIICANHSTWWDGYVALLVARQLGVDPYLMMEEAQLRRYLFFSWIGCFSVDRQNARSAMQSLQYAARILKEKAGRMVWLFPQGEIAPNDHRPLEFFTGAAHLARLTAPSLVYPLAIRIDYLAEQQPDLFISLGEPTCVDADMARAPGFLKQCTHQLETLVTAELDRLHADITASDYSSFKQLMQGRASTNRIFDAVLLRKQIGRQ